MNTQAELQKAARELRDGTFHQERLSRHSLLRLHRSRGASMRQRPDEKPKSLRESVNSICGTFAHQVLNIRHAISEFGPRGQEGQTGIQG